jgi:O-antigen ligase
MIGINIIRKYPLTGIGINQIRLIPEVGYKTARVHNQFIHTGADLGLPELISYLVILIGFGITIFEI